MIFNKFFFKLSRPFSFSILVPLPTCKIDRTYDLLGVLWRKSVCNAGDLCLIPGSGRFPWRRELVSTQGIFAWRIPCTEEPDRLYSSWGLKELEMTRGFFFFFNL